ncbi:MAG: hypothetical protein ACM3PS_17130, partial [Syntrophothermus sp.]
GTMTSSERFWMASMRYGDELVSQGNCEDALAQYDNAKAIAELDQAAAKNYVDAFNTCYPATPTVDLTLTATVGTPAVTDTPSSYP